MTVQVCRRQVTAQRRARLVPGEAGAPTPAAGATALPPARYTRARREGQSALATLGDPRAHPLPSAAYSITLCSLKTKPGRWEVLSPAMSAPPRENHLCQTSILLLLGCQPTAGRKWTCIPSLTEFQHRVQPRGEGLSCGGEGGSRSTTFSSSN